MQRRGDGCTAQAAEGDRRRRVADRAFPFLQRGRVAARGRGDLHERADAFRRLARHRLDRRGVAQVGMDDGTEAFERRRHVVP